jgi:hypothetical protein
VRKLRWGRDGRGKSGGVRHLLRSQRRHAAVPADDVRQERTGEPDPGRMQRVGRHG